MSKNIELKKIYFFCLKHIQLHALNCILQYARIFTAALLIICFSNRIVLCNPFPTALQEEPGSSLFLREPDKMIALTFDDGPHYKYTPMILDSLKKYNAKATFFVLGDRIKYTPEIIERISAEGHSIGNHTFSHVELTNVNKERAYNEIKKTNDIIYELTNKKPFLIRPPLGARNKKTDALIKDEGMSTILWNIDSRDWISQNTDKIFKHVKKNARDGDIILMHDFYPETAEAVEKILDALIRDGFKFVTVNELIESKINFEPGVIYYSQKRIIRNN